MMLTRQNRLRPIERFEDEALYTTQNGYLGVRGCFEEHSEVGVQTMRGTYINAFYDTHTLVYGEDAYGLPKDGQSIVNVMDPQTILFKINGQPINLETCSIKKMTRSYHLRDGYTSREVTYVTPEHQTFVLTFRRMAHLKHRALFIIEACITSPDYEGPVTVESILEGNVSNQSSGDDPRLGTKHAKKLILPMPKSYQNYGTVSATTAHTGFKVHALMHHDCPMAYTQTKSAIIAEKTFNLKKNQTETLTKYVWFMNSLDHDDLEHTAYQAYQAFNEQPFDTQKEAINMFYESATVQVETDDEALLTPLITYNLYQLWTSVGHSMRTNIAAKGLSGEGYEGHTFWDTEIYMIPFFMQVDPEKAKLLLLNRYSQLPEAKKEAALLGVHEGIKFAWRTINGTETSPYYPAGQAQYHINSAVSYAFIKFYQLHQDKSFFLTKGLEILIETARFFKAVLHKHKGHWHMHHVTGPDEYTAVVNNNYYTNAMLKYQLDFMLDFIKTHSKECEEILSLLHVNNAELALYKDISEHIMLPYDETLGIDLQDQDFLSKPLWPSHKQYRPLLLYYHPLDIYRHATIKQADTVLAHVLLGRDGKVFRRSFNYYEPLTTHDSSLSMCIHAVAAAKLNDVDQAYDLFKKSVLMDWYNTHGNVQHGLHIANAGGIYLALTQGFINLTIGKTIQLSPRLPKAIKRLALTLRINEIVTLGIEVTHGQLTLSPSAPITIEVYKQILHLKEPVTIPIPS